MQNPPDPNANVPANPYTRRWTAERPNEVSGEYQPREEHRGGNAAKTVGGAAAGIALLLAKFKGLLYLLLSFKWIFFLGKFASFGFTFLLSLWVYALFFGWRFGVIFIVMIAIHEFGHFFAFRAYGLSPKLPTFIPLLGAATVGKMPMNATQEAFVALAGPFAGLVACIGALALAGATHDRLWIAAAYLGAFINLLNMIPVPPFDGGGIAAVFSPRIWIVGMVLFVVAMFYLHISPIFLILIAVLGIPRVIAAFKGNFDARYYQASAPARLLITACYLGVAVSLAYLLNISHITVAM